ncbi:MAG: electron transport complex subunit E [Lachnospiraceae bacterium]|jgi:electron transport complex protein RnfE|nr:electron transport complex subunit E [Lachnospiraceae bacterium]
MNKYAERLYNGIVKENPTFILMLGMCPTLAVTTSAFNGLGMGLSTMVVLVVSNLLISALRNIIPDKVRIPAYIVVVASLVTIVQLLIQAYIPVLYDALGLYIPLIVVNCIILGRAEAYASKNSPGLSVFDGLGMGFGFSIALTCIGFFRELIGAGTLLSGTPFAMSLPEAYEPVSIFVLAPGAFLVLALIIAFLNAMNIQHNGNKKVEGCDGNCASCGQSQGCTDAKN